MSQNILENKITSGINEESIALITESYQAVIGSPV